MREAWVLLIRKYPYDTRIPMTLVYRNVIALPGMSSLC